MTMTDADRFYDTSNQYADKDAMQAMMENVCRITDACNSEEGYLCDIFLSIAGDDKTYYIDSDYVNLARMSMLRGGVLVIPALAIWGENNFSVAIRRFNLDNVDSYAVGNVFSPFVVSKQNGLYRFHNV